MRIIMTSCNWRVSYYPFTQFYFILSSVVGMSNIEIVMGNWSIQFRMALKKIKTVRYFVDYEWVYIFFYAYTQTSSVKCMYIAVYGYIKMAQNYFEIIQKYGSLICDIELLSSISIPFKVTLKFKDGEIRGHVTKQKGKWY